MTRQADIKQATQAAKITTDGVIAMRENWRQTLPDHELQGSLAAFQEMLASCELFRTQQERADQEVENLAKYGNKAGIRTDRGVDLLVRLFGDVDVNYSFPDQQLSSPKS